MVKLSLISPKGNQGVRFFPHQGYLGLTPLKFEGLVRTQIEQDGKSLLAKDINVIVRCYESRQSRLGTVQTNVLFEQSVTLWQKHSGQDWSHVGDSEHPFRLFVPSQVTAPSTALYFQEYRIFWRIEAVMNHVPVTGVGSRQVKHFDLPLVRYDTPVSLSPSALSTPPSSSHSAPLMTKSRSSTLRCHVLVPPNPIGPLDIVSVQLIVQPLDPTMSIRSASALVERRIHLNDVPSAPPTPSAPTSSQVSLHPLTYFSSSTTCSPSPDSNSSTLYPGSNNSATTSLQDLHFPTSSSVHSDNSSRPLLQNALAVDDLTSPSSDRGTTHIFAHAESSGRFTRDSSGTWKQTLTFSWPDTKSTSRWAVGETLQTDMATVKFFLRIKLVVSSPVSSAETVELEDKELVIVSTNDSQRQLALSRYSELGHTSRSRSKSKSPRRSKRDRLKEQLPSSPRSPRPACVSEEAPMSAPVVSRTHQHTDVLPRHAYKFSSSSAPYPGNSSQKSKSSRRPHTSAGLRDKPTGFDSRGCETLRNPSNHLTVPLRPETACPTAASNTQSSRGIFRQKWIEAPRLGSRTSVSSDGHVNHGDTCQPPRTLLVEKVNQVDMRAWEEELARIESVSQQSSADMVGFASQRKKATRERPSVRTYLRADG
ncbi:hypothetical protein F5I97DRAFT_1846049 [Phlebopus sp. FC_14]|nr:hypothetical protein F5I97DRAFT_1846049 [Phlebopus sp. FC_14]